MSRVGKDDGGSSVLNDILKQGRGVGELEDNVSSAGAEYRHTGDDIVGTAAKEDANGYVTSDGIGPTEVQAQAFDASIELTIREARIDVLEGSSVWCCVDLFAKEGIEVHCRVENRSRRHCACSQALLSHLDAF